MQMREPPGITGVTRQSDCVASNYDRPRGDKHTATGQVRVERHCGVGMNNGDQICTIPPPVRASVVGPPNSASPARCHDCADIHDEIVAIFPKAAVPKPRTIRLVDYV